MPAVATAASGDLLSTSIPVEISQGPSATLYLLPVVAAEVTCRLVNAISK